MIPITAAKTVSSYICNRPKDKKSFCKLSNPRIYFTNSNNQPANRSKKRLISTNSLRFKNISNNDNYPYMYSFLHITLYRWILACVWRLSKHFRIFIAFQNCWNWLTIICILSSCRSSLWSKRNSKCRFFKIGLKIANFPYLRLSPVTDPHLLWKQTVLINELLIFFVWGQEPYIYQDSS